MNRSTWVLGVAAVWLGLAVERDASACGGCFTPPTQVASDITDERMLLTVSSIQTTLYDQIQYSGSPASFAWVLPIKGTVTVGLSADVLFDSFDALTATQILQPPSTCPAGPICGFGGAATGTSAVANGAAEAPTVTVTKQENVGPYDTVQLHATDPNALNNWLAQNSFVIPAAVTPVIDEYVAEGFDFLAMKLLPGQGVSAMRPVRVSSPGASLSLPLRMAAIGTGATVGITIWIVADGRYEPQNFPFFHIDDSALVWDWSTSLSNYTTLRVQNEAALGNKGWEIESSLTLNQQTISNTILSGGVYYGNGFGGPGGGLAAIGTSDPALDYLPTTGPDGGALGDAGAEEARTEDINALFVGLTGPNARVTRIRSDIAHAAMTADLVLQASADQSELSNIRTVTQSVNEHCPIYQGCSVVGTGTPAQSAASVAAANASGASGGVNGYGGGSVTGTATGITTGIVSGVSGGGTTATSTSTSVSPNLGAPAPAPTSGGCVTAPQAGASSAAGFGAFAGMLGLVLARTLRQRRRTTKKEEGTT
jgi:hypothetical protein